MFQRYFLLALLLPWVCLASLPPTPHVFVYVNGAGDVSPPALMDALVAIQANELRNILLKRLPADHVHVYSGNDYKNGIFKRDLDAVAKSGGTDPVDMLTLSHSGGHTMPLGSAADYDYFEFKDTLFAAIPANLKSRLRLFFNAGCHGARAFPEALEAGFKQVTGAAKNGIFYGNPGLVSFLQSWLQNQNAYLAAANTNWECRHSPAWLAWAISGVDGHPEDIVQGAYAMEKFLAAEAKRPAPSEPKREVDMEAYCKTTDLAVIESRTAPKDTEHQPPTVPPLAPAHNEFTDLPNGRFSPSMSMELRKKAFNSFNKNSLVLSFEPTPGLLPVRIAIDMKNPQITEADATLLKLWIFSLFSYHRNQNGNVAHDAQFMDLRLPVYSTSIGRSKALTRLTVQANPSVGYRWMDDDKKGIYVEPRASVDLTAQILNRIFATTYTDGSYTAIGGGEPNYFSATLGQKIAFGADYDGSLRIFLKGDLRFTQANEATILPMLSNFLGAGLEWNPRR